MSNEAWSLNASPASQLQAALAALAAADWQLMNFDHDVTPDTYPAHDTYDKDREVINLAHDHVIEALKLLSEVQGFDTRLDIGYISQILPVVAMLQPRTPSEIDLANYRSALNDLDNNF